jgi:hypothetical protein
MPKASLDGCIRPQKFQSEAGNKSWKMVNVCNSESDSDHEDRGDELTGVHAGMTLDSRGRPVDQSHKPANDQANALRAAASQAVSGPSSQASRFDLPLVQERKATPLNSDDEAQPRPYDQERAIAREKKMARAPLEKSSQISESLHPMATRS